MIEWLAGRHITDVVIGKIIEKYGSYPYDYPLHWKINYVNYNIFKVHAWQDKYGSTINNVTFQIRLGKRDVKRYITDITEDMSEGEFDRLIEYYGDDIL